MNRYAMAIGIGMTLFGSIGLYSSYAQTQSKGFGVGDYHSIYEFTLKDGTPCVLARSDSGSSTALSCGWERSHGTT